MQEALQAAGPGRTVYIASGDYGERALELNHGGLDNDRRLTLQGVDTGGGLPHFSSDFSRSDPGGSGKEFLKLNEGVGYVTVQNLRLHRYNIGIRMKGPNPGVRINDVDVRESREGIRVEAGATTAKPRSGTSDLIISDCDFTHYTKRGIRLRGGVSNVTIFNCHADAGGGDWYVESFPIGFTIEGGRVEGVVDQDITYEDCTARNNWQTRDREYWNADGFTAERDVRNVTYRRCGAFGNTDGGWDFKAQNVVLEDCVAIDNKRNYRIWSGGETSDDPPIRLINCFSGYSNLRGGIGNPMGVHIVHGANVVLDHVTIIDQETGIELSGKDDLPATVTVRNSILLVPDGQAIVRVGNGSDAIISDTTIIDIDHSEKDPDFIAPREDWAGEDNSFDSREFPERGYRHR